MGTGLCITSMRSGNKLPSRRAALGAGLGAVAVPAVARGQERLRWRMVTSWPKGRAGPGVSAKRIADRINAMAGGRSAEIGRAHV